jgi:hypothetical protein
MSIFNQSLTSYGGALLDQTPIIDVTVDRSASGMNPALSSNGGMTLTSTKAWILFQPAGTGVPLLIREADMWSNNTANAASAVTRTTTGVYVIHCPAIIFDDIPVALGGVSGPVPGSTPAGVAVSLTTAFAACEGTSSATDYDCSAWCNANLITVYIRAGGSRALTDPTGINFSVYAT